MRLEAYLAATGIDPTRAMNYLQKLGAISDNCIEPADVAEQDQPTAIAILEGVDKNRQ